MVCPRTNVLAVDMEPKMTSDGKYQCEADDRVFNTREEYDMHCNQAHSRSSEKGW